MTRKHETLVLYDLLKIINGKGSFSKEQTAEIHCPPTRRTYFTAVSLHWHENQEREKKKQERKETRAAAFFQAVKQTNATTLGNAGAP